MGEKPRDFRLNEDNISKIIEQIYNKTFDGEGAFRLGI